MKEVILKTIDGISIAVNCFENGGNEVVIIAPGWCMTKDSRSFHEISQMFSKHFDVLTFDFRGHGKSNGAYTFTAKELNDLDAVVKYAKNGGYEKIYLVGFSLGAGMGLIYTAQNPMINKLIAVSPHSDFSKIENKMWKKEAWGETFKKFELIRFLSIRPSIIPYKKIKPIDVVSKISVPTLFIAGEKDPTVCVWHAKALYEKALCEKELKVYENGIHAEDLFLHYENDFSNKCVEWLKKTNTCKV